MFRLKTFISALLITAPVLFGTNSFAFDMPKELAPAGEQDHTQQAIFTLAPSDISPGNESHAKNMKTVLLTQYSQWKGTHYHLGGSTHKGVDCSALMQHIFNDSMHQQLPRTTFQQIKNGQKVSKDNLKPGDLVFFKTTSNTRHVGVYVGDNEFIHASKIKGVTISSLNDQYWMNHYETARRLELMS